MEDDRFDALVRGLGRGRSRRGVLGVLAGTTLGALVAMPRVEEAEAACRDIFDVCTSTKQCCGHKHHKRICAENPQINDQEPTCCIPEGKRCDFGGQCCANGNCNGNTHRCEILVTSDRAVKTDLATVDGQAVLAQVAALPISSWRYQSDDPAVRHIGPMAQDFAAVFQVGDDDRAIHVVDGQGVALAAIQGLTQELRTLQAENAALAARVADLEGRQKA